jgi:hypothetical protein
MDLRGRLTVLAVAATALVAGPAALNPGAAQAQTVTYGSTAILPVPDDTGPAGVTSTIVVPPGTGAVQLLEVTNFRVQWGASAQELSTQLIAPDGTFMNLFEVGCGSGFDAPDIWAFSDGASQTAFNDKFDPKCDLPGGTFRPVDLPENRKLSIFSGKQASGNWTLRAVDNGVTFNNQGTILSWAVRITHAAAPPAAQNVRARKKCKKGRKLKKGKCVRKKKRK